MNDSEAEPDRSTGTPHPDRSTTGGGLLVVAVIVVGLTLRGPIVAVAPVLDDIRRDLEVSSASAGLLTSMPVLCFAAVSPLAALFARRVGANIAIAVSLVVLAVGIAGRPWAGFGLMLAGTILIGAAIAVGNVLLPVIIRRDFAARAGPVLSASTTSLIVSATIPALLVAPLAGWIGWRPALAVWAALAVGALLLWLAATGRRSWTHADDDVDPRGQARTAAPGVDRTASGQPVRTALRTPDAPTQTWRVLAAWELGIYFGLQSFLFYATTAWLPAMLRDEGVSAEAAGTALSLFQLLGIAGTLAVPLLIRRQPARYVTAVILAAMWIVFLAGVLLAPEAWALWCVVGGVGQGGGLAIALSLITLRSDSSEAARAVSAMVQTVAYCLAAAGPVLVGSLSAASSGWTVPFSLLIAVSAAWGLLGFRAASSHPIGLRDRSD
ncbi:MFS transporter [Phytoactinopolyspora halotolerans]|uniref:MFS transporter n=1 Tax=Phytoactinopolyspora halotolerans TaxID=1981512 RepID=A0A6L9S8C3_9ACTN|nr:MFS transporter [Phytoactinopolyspora halotolerans]NEE01273.1 MFS transporter [Phytoactinopolyspora halotolerans]